MTVAALEALTFGLGRLAAAADRAGERLCLLTGDRDVYRHELSLLGPGSLDIVDVDTHDEAACAAVLKGLPELRGLISSTDTWAVTGADLATRFGLPGPDPQAVRTLRDKRRVRVLLHEQGLSRGTAVDVPAGPAGTAAVRACGLPAVLKDTAGTSSRGVWPVHDETELAAALTAAAGAPLRGRLLAEPFLAGPVYSAETLTWAGRTRLLGVCSRQMSPLPEVREEASALPVALPAADADEIGDWAGRVLAAAGHGHGFAHVEFVYTTSGPELVEINARIGGAMVGEALCRCLGMNVYEAMIDVALGRPPALLDATVGGGPAVGFALVHARQPGVLERVDGVADLAAYPGGPEWYPTMPPGTHVEHLRDQRACTGILLAEGVTAELALHRVLAAAGSLRPVIVG